MSPSANPVTAKMNVVTKLLIIANMVIVTVIVVAVHVPQVLGLIFLLVKAAVILLTTLGLFLLKLIVFSI